MRCAYTTRTLMIGLVIWLACLPAQAKKSNNPSGGGDAPAYTIIPFLPPGLETIASGVSDLNEAGQAVGWAETADGAFRAIHLDIANDDYTTLLSAADAVAAGINHLNQIVGADGVFGAFWDGPSAPPVVLEPLDATSGSSSVQSWATSINDGGIVIGASRELYEDGTSRTVAVVWRVVVDNDRMAHVDGPLPLLPLNGHLESFAGSGCLNELASGTAQVAGYSSGPREAVVWTIGLNTDGTLALPGLPVSLAPSPSRGDGINNLGDVCGRSDRRPFVAPAGQEPQELPVPRNTQDGYANEMNDLGEIVGQLDIQKRTWGGTTDPPQWHAYLWRGGQMIDLEKQIASNSGWDKLEWANTIDNAGMIGGSGHFDVQHRGFLMIPNEP